MSDKFEDALKFGGELAGVKLGNLRNFDESRAFLVELLSQTPLPKITGLWELDEEELTFLTATCAATIIEFTLCIMTGYNEKMSLEGLDTLVAGMRESIRRRCR